MIYKNIAKDFETTGKGTMSNVQVNNHKELCNELHAICEKVAEVKGLYESAVLKVMNNYLDRAVEISTPFSISVYDAEHDYDTNFYFEPHGFQKNGAAMYVVTVEGIELPFIFSYDADGHPTTC